MEIKCAECEDYFDSKKRRGAISAHLALSKRERASNESRRTIRRIMRVGELSGELHT
jgi:hypothetical protein